ncbi:MAG: VOC family protein [Clostridia bacterium]|nr:VOC family protein [Clostridia bacterium]
MNLKTIHHIAIICSDKDAALRFYHDILGFPIIRSNFREERGDWKIDLAINENTELELFVMKDRPKRVSNPEAYGLRHLAFTVSSVADTVAELEGLGISCEPIRFDAYTNKRMTFFRDPDGLPIEIHE